MKRLLVVLLSAPAPLAAQSYAITPYAAQNRSLPGTPSLLGVSASAYSGLVGLRLGGAFGAGESSVVPTGTTGTSGASVRADAWTGDADAVLDLGRLPGLGLVLGGFAPAAFAGVGAEGMRASGSAQGAATTPVWSYGAIVGHTLFGGLRAETEARYRVPFSLDRSAVPAGIRKGWEYRVGLSLRFGGSAARASSPARVPAPPERDRPRTVPASASARRVLGTADDYLGTRYQYGGNSPSGFDCSGFTQYVFARNGVTLPRTSRQQAAVGDRAPSSIAALRPGDLVFFASNGSRVDHVAIFAGDNRIVHSTASGGGVRYDDLGSSRGRWFVAHHVASRRVLADGRSLVRSIDAAALRPDALDPPDSAPRP
jgi:cell wall-associated NlpC family hydrolase